MRNENPGNESGAKRERRAPPDEELKILIGIKKDGDSMNLSRVKKVGQAGQAFDIS